MKTPGATIGMSFAKNSKPPTHRIRPVVAVDLLRSLSPSSVVLNRWGATRRAFTLIEVLVVVAILAMLGALLLPVLVRAKAQARSVQCISNLRQLSLAAQLYWDDHDNRCFKYLSAYTNNGVTYWFGWMENGREGDRAFDATQGALYPYLQGRGVELCPALDYAMARFKLKATGAAYGYGFNKHLSGVNLARMAAPADHIVFADAAQVNDFQAPASPAHPLLEEFYYVSASPFEATAHFRHSHGANAVFGDGHVEREPPVPGSLDDRLPDAWVGRLRPEALQLP